jgi:TRAP-type C4-dicarboxylate transport system permease small subunit
VVVLIVYLALHHARLAGWLRTYSAAAFNALCFLFVVVAWYVVNCAWRSGQHDDAFGTGPLSWVYVAVAIELMVVFAAGFRVAWQAYISREAQRLGMELPQLG